MVCFAFFKTWNYFNNWFVLSVYQKQNISGIHINTDLDTDAFQTLDLLKTPTFQMKKGGKKTNKHQYKEHYLWEEISSFSHREKKTLKLLKLEFLRPSQLDLKLQCSSYLLHGFIDQWNPGAQDFQALFFARRTSKKLRNPEETERIKTPRRWTDRSISAKNSSAIVCLPTTNYLPGLHQAESSGQKECDDPDRVLPGVPDYCCRWRVDEMPPMWGVVIVSWFLVVGIPHHVVHWQLKR